MKNKSAEFYAHSSSVLHKKCKIPLDPSIKLHLIPHFDEHPIHILYCIYLQAEKKNNR